MVREAGHPLPVSERQDDPNSFLKEDSDVGSVPETDSLSSTSDKSDPSQELTVNCTGFPQSLNGVAPATDMGLSGTTAVLQPPSVEELSASDGGCGTGSELSANEGEHDTRNKLSASEGGCGTGSGGGGGHGTGNELDGGGGGRGRGSELDGGGGGCGTGSELDASGVGRGNRRDKKHRGHPKAGTRGWFGRNKKQAACGTEKAKVPIIFYYGMGAGRFCM